MSEKKTTEGFYVTEKVLKEIHALIGFSEKSEKSKSECYVDFFEKLILDKSSPAPNSPSGEQITSDVPLTRPSLQERAKTDPALKEFLEKVKPVDELPPPPCDFVGKGYIEKKLNIQMVFCGAFWKYKKPTAIPLTSCQSCWNGREKYKAKQERKAEERERELAENPPPQPQPIRPRLKTFTEKMSDGTLEWKCEKERETFLMKNLPCLLDHSFKCPHKECDKRLTELLASYMSRVNEDEMHMVQLQPSKM